MGHITLLPCPHRSTLHAHAQFVCLCDFCARAGRITTVYFICTLQVTVALGEQIRADGTVPPHAESNNHWLDTWTLALPGAHGAGTTQTFVPHEYCEFRWAEVTGAPEPPSHARIAGWQAHYPFDGELNEGGAAAPVLLTAGDDDASGLSVFQSSDDSLQQVWALVRHTIDAGPFEYCLRRFSSALLTCYPCLCGSNHPAVCMETECVDLIKPQARPAVQIISVAWRGVV